MSKSVNELKIEYDKLKQEYDTKRRELASIAERMNSIVSEAEKLMGVKSTPKKETIKEDEMVDVRNTFVCVYNGNHVGLFKKTNYSTKNGDPRYYRAGSVYEGINSNYIGLKETCDFGVTCNRWRQIGERVIMNGIEYEANCKMNDGMSFDDMRLIMYKDGKIGSYTLGKASSEDMIDVLSYASEYYNLNPESKQQLIK